MLLLLCALPARAAEAGDILGELLELEELTEAGEETGLSDYGSFSTGFDVSGFLEQLTLETLQAAVSRELWRDIAAAALAVLLLGVLRGVFGPGEGSFDVLSLAGAAAVTGILAGGHTALFTQAERAIYDLRDAANILLPTLGTASLLSGEVTAAGAKYASAALFFGILTNLSVTVVLPLLRLYLAAAAAEAAVGEGPLTAVLGILKWGVTGALSALMLAFTFYLTVTGLTASSADAALLRSAKTALVTMLPVVGGIAGDAAASLLASANLFRQTVGSFGLLLIAAALAAPFLRTGLRYLLLKGVSALAGGLADKSLGRLLSRFAEAMAILLGCMGAMLLMLWFTVFSMMGAVIR